MLDHKTVNTIYEATRALVTKAVAAETERCATLISTHIYVTSTHGVPRLEPSPRACEDLHHQTIAKTLRETAGLPAPVVSQFLWVWHSPYFASLMLDRIEVAQIKEGNSTSDWHWTLRFCRDNEVSCYSSTTKEQAMRIAEEHAMKITRPVHKGLPA